MTLQDRLAEQMALAESQSRLRMIAEDQRDAALAELDEVKRQLAHAIAAAAPAGVQAGMFPSEDAS